jgi:alpha-L-rhamnosidase
VIRPEVVGDLQQVASTYQTLYGEVKVEWKRTGNEVELEVSIPTNCSADIYLPHRDEPERVLSGTYTFKQAF